MRYALRAQLGQKAKRRSKKQKKQKKKNKTKIVNKMQIKIIGNIFSMSALTPLQLSLTPRVHNKASLDHLNDGATLGRPTWGASVCISNYLRRRKRTRNAATPRRPADNKVFNRKMLLTYCPPGGPCPGRSKKEHEKQRDGEKTGLCTLWIQLNCSMGACGTGTGIGIVWRAVHCWLSLFWFYGCIECTWEAKDKDMNVNMQICARVAVKQ